MCLDTNWPELNEQQRQAVPSAAAVAAYHAEADLPIVGLLLCDDALQFNWIAEELAFCGVHERRHDKKLLSSFVHQPSWKRVNGCGNVTPVSARVRKMASEIDTSMSLAATAKKLGISFYQYIHDHVSKANEIQSSASLIESRASELELGASWSIASLDPIY